MKQILLSVAILVAGFAHAHTALLEACNSIDDRAKRLACLKELSDLKSPAPSDASTGKAAFDRVSNAFSSVAGAVKSGISYNNYTSLILEPAKELEIFKRSTPKPSDKVVENFENALIAYKDAETVWHAAIYKSSDGGFLGRILDPRYTGLMDIVETYSLPVRQVLLAQTLSSDSALQIIWQYALRRAESATRAFTPPPAAAAEATEAKI